MDHIKPVWATIEAGVGPEAGMSSESSAQSSISKSISQSISKVILAQSMRVGPRHKARHANSLDKPQGDRPLKQTLNTDKCDYYCLMGNVRRLQVQSNVKAWVGWPIIFSQGRIQGGANGPPPKTIKGGGHTIFCPPPPRHKSRKLKKINILKVPMLKTEILL